MNIVQYRNIRHQTREYCLICEKKAADPVIRLPDFPLTEIYVDKKVDEKLGYVDQAFQLCEHCGHGQLANVIDVELQYGDVSTYYFRTSQSESGRETTGFFIDFLERVVGDRTFRTIVEVGCNDLFLLKSLKARAQKLIGIDPILRGTPSSDDDKVFAIGDFFENVALDTDVDVIICKDALEHVSCPKQFLKKMVDSASDDTLFFFQFPILDTLVADCRFDQVFHQHLNYFSLKSILYLLDELGCGLLEYDINYNHWAPVLIAFKKGADSSRHRSTARDVTAAMVRERYALFKRDMEQTKQRLEWFRNDLCYGYGAALMLPVLSYHLETDLACLKCIIDDDAAKDGLFYLNLPIPIAHRSKIADIGESVVLLTAISSRINTKRILAKLFELNPRYILYPLRTI